MLKRTFDIVFSVCGLIALSPLLIVVSAVNCLSPGSIFFRQKRVGRYGEDFYLLKFRSMTGGCEDAVGVFDPGNKSRVTTFGEFLRASKIDELPQLWNVLKGEMSLVGPRPEVRSWVECYPDQWRYIHEIRPGITDPASIYFRNEERVLAQATNPEQTYREIILPKKLTLYENYVASHSFWGDLIIIFQTFKVLLCSDKEART